MDGQQYALAAHSGRKSIAATLGRPNEEGQRSSQVQLQLGQARTEFTYIICLVIYIYIYYIQIYVYKKLKNKKGCGCGGPVRALHSFLDVLDNLDDSLSLGQPIPPKRS